MIGIRPSALLAGASTVLLLAGCGGAGPSEPSLADFAAPDSVVFVEARLRSSGELGATADAIAKRLVGTGLAKPWLGEEGAVAFKRLEGGKLSEPLIAVQVTDPEAARAFVDERAKANGGFKGDAGVVGNALVIADDKRDFKAAVDASRGESLADEDRFQAAIDSAPDSGVADAYIDVGGIVEQSKGQLNPTTRALLEGTGVDLSDATALASVIPRSRQVEIDVSSDLGGQTPPWGGNGSALLGSLPASAVAAFGFGDAGETVGKALATLDRKGVSPDLKPGELTSILSQAGVDLDRVSASLDEGALFVEGDDRAGLGGALLLTAESNEAAGAVADLGALLRAAQVPGVTAVGGDASGFSVRSAELGNRPAVVVGKGKRIAVGYGLAPALAALNRGSGTTLSGEVGYKEAVAALGKTPIGGYLDGPAALRLAKSLVPRSSTEFWDAVPYLAKITYVGIGSKTDDGLATARLVAGIGG